MRMSNGEPVSYDRLRIMYVNALDKLYKAEDRISDIKMVMRDYKVASENLHVCVDEYEKIIDRINHLLEE